MGRAKLKMELMSNEKLRNKAFKLRTKGLITKIHELTVLCDINACMMIYGPKQDNGTAAEPPVIWPNSPDKVGRIINDYKARNKDSGVKKFGLSDFFGETKKKVIAEPRKQNVEAKFPTYMEFMDLLTEDQLREFASKLKDKSEYVRSRIQLLKRNMSIQSQNFYNHYGSIDEDINHREISLPVHHLTNNYHQNLHPANQNQITSGSGCYPKFGVEFTNGSLQFNRQVLYDSAGERWVVDPMICGNPMPLAWYCEHVLSPPPPPYAAMSGLVAPPRGMQFSSREHDLGCQYHDSVRYQMINHGAMC